MCGNREWTLRAILDDGYTCDIWVESWVHMVGH
jgi:hypothetical protein